MAKITRHICDFNVNLKEHDAHWFVTVRSSKVGPGEETSKDFDLCSQHLMQALAPVLNANGFKDVVVRKNGAVETPAVGVHGNKVNDGDSKRYECPECDGTFSNLSSHMKGVHGMTPNEWRIAHGIEPVYRGGQNKS